MCKYNESCVIRYARALGPSGYLSVPSTLKNPAENNSKTKFWLCTYISHIVANTETVLSMYRVIEISEISSYFINKKTFQNVLEDKSQWRTEQETANTFIISWRFRIASGSITVTWTLNCNGAHENMSATRALWLSMRQIAKLLL
jgi:hypothetical protein